MRKQTLLLLTVPISFILMSSAGTAQVAINTDNSAPNPSAMLDIKNTGKGVLIPRMTQVQRDAIVAPADGLMIYQINSTPGFYYNAGTATSPVWQTVGGQSKTASQIALLQWYHPIATYNTESSPRGIAFDGKNMWVTIAAFGHPSYVKRYNASGTVVGSSPPGTDPRGIAFDGTHMWIVNEGSPRGVTKINASTGAFVAFYATPDPSSIAFDGTNVWVTNVAYVSVTKINVTTGALATYDAGNYPNSIAFDGTNIWVTNSNSFVTKINRTTGAVISDYEVGGDYNFDIAFDGINMWISVGTNTVKKLNLSGDVVGTFSVNSPGAKAFDGTDMWICNTDHNTVTRMNTSGNILTVYPVGIGPTAIAFDGAHMWITSGDNKITKIHK